MKKKGRIKWLISKLPLDKFEGKSKKKKYKINRRDSWKKKKELF